MNLSKILLTVILACNFLFPSSLYASSDLSNINSNLVKMGENDQNARKIIKTSSNRPLTKAEKLKISHTDKQNTKYLKSLHQEYDWDIIFNHLKTDGYDALFLIVQHSEDATFQNELLPKMKILYKKKIISGQKLALLTDRILTRQGKKQLYGTQADVTNSEIVFKPIIDLKNLARRRRSLKLPTIEFYKKILEELYGIKDHGLMDK